MCEIKANTEAIERGLEAARARLAALREPRPILTGERRPTPLGEYVKRAIDEAHADSKAESADAAKGDEK